MRLLAILLAALALAGCLDPRTTILDEGEAIQGPTAAEQRGVMTAAADPIQERAGETDTGHYVERVLRISGTSSLNAMLLALSTTNGDIEVAGTSGNGWEVVFTLRGEGGTPEEARERAESLAVEWNHEADGLHFLDAHVRTLVPDADGTSGTIKARFPTNTRYSLDLLSVNGDVWTKGLAVPAGRLQSTNGNVDATLRGSDLRLATTNGDVTLVLVPLGSGRITLASVNGDAEAELDEIPSVGYRVTASSTNGEAEVTLDGRTLRQPPGSEPATATSAGYDRRDLKIDVEARSTNGDATVTGT